MKKKSIKYLATAVVSAAVIISGCGSTAGSQSSVSEQTAVQSEVASSSAESSSAAQAAASESTDTASVAASSTSVAESTTEAVNDDGWKEAFSDYITQRSALDMRLLMFATMAFRHSLKKEIVRLREIQFLSIKTA